MSFIPVPNGISLCFHFETAGQGWQFCLTLKKSAGAPTPTDLATVVANGGTWWDDELKQYIHSSTTLAEIVATDLTTQGGPQSIAVVNEAGTGGDDATPLGTALVVSTRTQKRGRSYRGRAYVGGLPSSTQISAVDVSALGASGYATTFAALGTQLDAIGFDVVVASKMHNGVVTNPAETNEVIAYVVDQHYDSQRRRLAGRGT